MGDMLSIARSRRADQYWQLVAQRNAIKARFIEAMQAAKVDMLLTPAIGTPAFPHGGSRDLTPACSYTFLWNLLHFPAGTVPVSHTRADECAYACPPAQDDAFAGVAKKAMVGAAGLPVGVQLVGLPYQEEAVLHAMRALEAALAQAQAVVAASAATGAASSKGPARFLCPEDTLQATVTKAKEAKGATVKKA